jgi:hypothetical protein
MRLFLALLLCAFVCTATPTTITDVVLQPNSSLPAAGVDISITQTAFFSGNIYYPAWALTPHIVSDSAGNLTVALEPNPTGQLYNVTMKYPNGVTTVSCWNVPVSVTPLIIKQVLSTTCGTPPLSILQLGQLAQGGATLNQVMTWNGTTWGPANAASVAYQKASYQLIRPAIVQAGTPALGVSTPSTNACTATAEVGSNTLLATCDFAAGVSQSIQDHFYLPPDWTGAIDVVLEWRAAATTGNVTWQMQTAGIAANGGFDPAFNSANTVTTNANGTTNLATYSSITALTLTGITADSEFVWKLSRSASDTMSGAAQLLSIRFTIRRTY